MKTKKITVLDKNLHSLDKLFWIINFDKIMNYCDPKNKNYCSSCNISILVNKKFMNFSCEQMAILVNMDIRLTNEYKIFNRYKKQARELIFSPDFWDKKAKK